MATLRQCVRCKEWKDRYFTPDARVCADCIYSKRINRKSKLCSKCHVRGTQSTDGMCHACRGLARYNRGPDDHDSHKEIGKLP